MGLGFRGFGLSGLLGFGCRGSGVQGFRGLRSKGLGFRVQGLGKNLVQGLFGVWSVSASRVDAYTYAQPFPNLL